MESGRWCYTTSKLCEYYEFLIFVEYIVIPSKVIYISSFEGRIK
jgi:hypothetical protein